MWQKIREAYSAGVSIAVIVVVAGIWLVLVLVIANQAGIANAVCVVDERTVRFISAGTGGSERYDETSVRQIGDREEYYGYWLVGVSQLDGQSKDWRIEMRDKKGKVHVRELSRCK